MRSDEKPKLGSQQLMPPVKSGTEQKYLADSEDDGTLHFLVFLSTRTVLYQISRRARAFDVSALSAYCNMLIIWMSQPLGHNKK